MKKRILLKLLCFVVMITTVFSSVAFAAFNPESKRISNKLTASFKIGKIISELVAMTWGDNSTGSISFDVEEGTARALTVRAMPKNSAVSNVGIVLQIDGDTDADVTIPNSIKVGTNAYLLQQYAQLSSLQEKSFNITFNSEGDYTLNIYAVQLNNNEEIVTSEAQLVAALGNASVSTIWLANEIYAGGYDVIRDGLTLAALNKGGVALSSSIKITGKNVTIDGLNITQTIVSGVKTGVYVEGDGTKIKDCTITGSTAQYNTDNNGVLPVYNKQIAITVQGTEFKNTLRGICLNGAPGGVGPTLIATNNKFTNVSYGIGGTENSKLGAITGNQFITGTEAFGLGGGVTSTVSGVNTTTQLKDYLLSNNTFTSVTNHVADYTVSPAQIYNKTN